MGRGERSGGDGSEATSAAWAPPAPLGQAAGVAACGAAVLAVLVFVVPRVVVRFGAPNGADVASLDRLHAILVALAFQWSLFGRETRVGQIGFGVAASWVFVLLLSAAAVFMTRTAG
jgi:hypothetical protein